MCAHTAFARASTGTVLNASRSHDGGVALSQATAGGNVPCLPCFRVVLVISFHGRVESAATRARVEEQRVDSEARDSESSEYEDGNRVTEPTANLDAIGHGYEVAQAASSVRRRQNEMV